MKTRRFAISWIVRSAGLIPVLMALAVSGCGGQPVSPPDELGSQNPAKPLVTESDVRQRFEQLRIRIGIPPLEGEKVVVRRQGCRNGLAQINDALRRSERTKFIVAGELTALDRDGECWVAELQQDLSGGQIAYFDDKGQLLLTWLPPEG